MCNKKSGIKIEADHFPKQFHKIMKEYNIKVFEQAEQCKELWDIKNGRTLCVPCHKENTFYGLQQPII